MPCAVILTALPVEYLAVRSHLNNLEDKPHPKGNVYEQGTFTERQTWIVGIAQIGAGNTQVSLEVERAIEYFKPDIILFVGVAGGIKGVELGDVVSPSQVYYYGSGVAAETFLPRPKVNRSDYRLEQLANSEANKSDWLKRLSNPASMPIPKVIANKPIASGEAVVKSSASEILQFLRLNYEDSVAVEMEGFGFLEAARANKQVPAMVIRGISDLIDNKAEVDKEGYQKIAAHHASAFAFEILAKIDTDSSIGLSPDQYTKLKQNLADTSKGLLSWQRRLINNQQIERSELDELLNRVKAKEFSTTIVLGAPGAGKSALMATFGNELVTQGHIVFAIKADQLNGAINTIEDLQRDLHLEFHPCDAIYAIARKERIVVLIDQLDAVSELLDRKSQRLNLLLSLIQRLSGSKNVHIVATCREFEFRYGSQFARLAEIEPLVLSLPPWEKIAPILETAGHQPTSIGEPLRELLQNPLHLNIFLNVAQPGDIFDSSQKLLDRLWEERVMKQPEVKKCVEFLDKLAERMTEEEVLWLPCAIADTSPEIWQALQQAGLLMTNPENSTIGFRHQTYYDHTLARAFARGSQSLTDLVLERQDGLFVRPILLRGLNYLRGTSPKQYALELKKLLTNAEVNNWVLKNKIAKLTLNLLTHIPYNLRAKGFSILKALRLIYIRKHISTLLVEFLGSQQNPEPVEVKLLTSLLKLETEGIKVLDATIGSPGWFRSFRDRPEFREWIEKPVKQAIYCSPFLTVAANFAPDDVWSLLEEYWLDNKTYDFLSIRVIWNIGQWTPERVWLIQQVIQRSNIDWDSVSAIAEKAAETIPDAAAKILRAHLDRLLFLASEASKLPPPGLPHDADEAERTFHAYQYNSLNPLTALLESENNFYEIEKFAKANPKSYLNLIWSWFTDIIQQISYDPNLNAISYRWDRLADFKFLRSEIIQSLLTAITELAKQDKPAFFKFVEQNSGSDLLVVHRLLAFGLEVVAPEEPIRVLTYLLADPRRLSLGRQTGDRHAETEKLIAAIFTYLRQEDRDRLEQAILKVKNWQPDSNKDVDFRRRCLEYNREHRLSLLQAIPEEYLNPQTKRLKEEEERALPWFNLRKVSGTVRGGIIGSRMKKEEMSRAKDQHLLNLFNKLPDQTEWDNSHRKWGDDISRAGGVVQQSREFGELVKDDPYRFLRILPDLKPQQHESYVGSALKVLTETDFPANHLIDLIEELDRQGFASENFLNEAAHALQKIAEQHHGLPQSTLLLLESWLSKHSQPELAHYRSKEDKQSELKSPIIFGMGNSHFLPSGRGNIVRAIADGYLRQDPPDLEGWTKFIRSQLGVETHPAVWVDILSRMPALLNGDHTAATELFDNVIRSFPEVLHYSFTLNVVISPIVGWVEPKETVQGWLEMLKSDHSNFSRQAYGEMLLLQYLQYQDEWSVERIRHHLVTQDNEAILCGLAHAASYLWSHQRCRAIAAEILSTLASYSSISVQHAVADVFRWSRDHFKLDNGMREIIRAVCQSKGSLLKSAVDLTEIIDAEELVDHYPEVVAEICKSLIAIGEELMNPVRGVGLIADSLTTCAIKLHRQPQYREVGLQIFEQLLALNLRETQPALETLDRRPTRLGLFIAPRRKSRKRRNLQN